MMSTRSTTHPVLSEPGKPPALPRRTGVRHALRRLHDDAPAHTAISILLCGLAVPTLLAHMLDARTIDGVGVWIKPLKFQLALAVYCLTLALYARFVPDATRRTRRFRTFTALVIVAILIEMIWLMAAAGVAERSHFNFTHPMFAPVYPVMGVLATILTAATAQYALAIGHHADDLLPAVKSGLVWGLGLTLPLTILTAFYLAAGTGHHVSADATGAVLGTVGSDVDGLALFGWSRSDGDLRVAHFFATHSLHAVPLIAIALAIAGWRSAMAGRAAALAWTALVAFAFVGATSGRPFAAMIG